MRKLIRKGQWGLNTGNIGAMNLKFNTPPMEPKLLTSSSLESIFGNNSGPSLSQSDGLSFFGNSGLSSTLSTAGSYLGAKYGGEFLKNGTTKLTEDFGKLLFKGMGGTSGIVSLGSNLVTSMLPERVQSDAYKKVLGALNLAKNIPGVGGLIATGLSTALEVTDWLGLKKIASLNNSQEIQDTLANTGGGYGDFIADWDEAKQYAGKNVGFWTGASKYNNMVYDANRLMSILQGIVGKKKTDDTLIALMGDRANERTMLDLNGGFGNVMFGRLGLKVEILPKVHAILNKPKVVDTLTEFEEEVPEFKEGGKMNVIPEGSLHARLHHMENADGLTKKGIPVVSIAEGGELEQQAEIELNEIIFRLEVTQELEKLMEDGSDNAAIEAGKLLVKEIFENTDDRTGLIKDLKPEKKESTTENIIKNHQVFLEGGNINKSNKTIDELVEEAIKQNPFFVQRIGPDMGYAEFVDKEGKTVRGTHYLETSTDDRGRYIVSPRIQMKNGKLQDLGDKAWEEAKRNKNYLVFESPEDAELFVTQYKNSKKWKPFFDIWERRYGSYKNGGIIERLNTLSPEQLDKLNEFLNGMLA